MSYDELRAEYERLKAQAAQVMAEQTPFEGEGAQLRELVERLEALTREYDQELSNAQTQIAETQAQLAEAEARITELKRELFGPKAERLTPEQQDKMNQLIRDLQAESQRPPPESGQVLQDEEPEKRKKRLRTPRHPLPPEIETETVTIEPQLTSCPGCGKMPGRIGEEVTEEIDLVPARLIRRRTVRPKYPVSEVHPPPHELGWVTV
ncbi:MAG: IS66 family transposase zinc-finger binding domain-containing protein [Acidobacteria bacterium]|nr:IS66 family transposase zinc-finger binding domain-containing protein [Acidobacteriota bacterium]